jgi:hypothetical protein
MGMDFIGVLWAIFSLWIAHKLVENLNIDKRENENGE